MTTSPESIALSKELKRRGWTFVGPTTVYAFMQAMGLVNDHLEGCHARAAALQRRRELKGLPTAALAKGGVAAAAETARPMRARPRRLSDDA